MADTPGSPLSAELDGSQRGSCERVRWSQYAENRPNPLPELAIDPEAPAPELVSNLEQESKVQDDANPFAGLRVARPPGSVQPDGGDERSAAVVFREPERSCIARHKVWIVGSLLVVLLILVGTVVGVVVKSHKTTVGGAGST